MTRLEKELRIYAPALALDRVLPRRVRKSIMWVHVWAISLLSIALLFFVVTQGADTLLTDARFYTGALLILLGTFFFFFQIALFYNALYYRGQNEVHPGDFDEREGITFEVARIVSRDPHDLTGSFLVSHYGSEILLRAGIDAGAIERFLASAREDIHRDALPPVTGTFTTLNDLGIFVFSRDAAFREFLFTQGVTEQLFHGALEWVSRVRLIHKNVARWWSKDNLGKMRGIGRELALGTAFTLNRFAQDINTTSVFSLYLRDTAYANDIIHKLETILTRTKSANVVLIGEPGVGSMDILIEFARRMYEGELVSSLLSKRIIVFNADLFVAAYGTKQEFEQAFISLMNEAVSAGNIIIVIENLASFTRSVEVIGSSAEDLLASYLTSSDIQIIATADPQSYHTALEAHAGLQQFFEPVHIDSPDGMNSVRVLEEATWAMEHRYQTLFTYPAVVRIVESAVQYIVEGVMPDKALSLQDHIGARAREEGIELIRREYVDRIVTEKTGIPIGAVTETERDLLMNLEEVLAKRVVGQTKALEVISKAMRRARAGVVSKEKPLGSFLFLGSTGVGKTETAKALAHTFFGSEEHMIRFDMSEFSGSDALIRLIGDGETPGVLATALRTHPYAVLLLDEFEKAAPSAHDLFLQVLDEGVFTDGHGKKVNARNTIIIATSNAGSELMWALAKEGKRAEDEKDTVIDTIITSHIFKPELINRFDAVVLFEVLKENEQAQIAELMLEELTARVRERGYTLIVNDALVQALMERGFSQEFGARPMRRAIQDIVEEGIARKILMGEVHTGGEIRFTPDDLK